MGRHAVFVGSNVWGWTDGPPVTIYVVLAQARIKSHSLGYGYGVRASQVQVSGSTIHGRVAIAVLDMSETPYAGATIISRNALRVNGTESPVRAGVVRPSFAEDPRV